MNTCMNTHMNITINGLEIANNLCIAEQLNNYTTSRPSIA